MKRNKTATAQVAIARVNSQSLMICHSGKVNRKKLRGFPKMESVALPLARAAYQKRPITGQSEIIVKPAITAKTIETASEMNRNAGSTEKLTGCPPTMIACLFGRLPSCVRLMPQNAAYKTAKVTTAATTKILTCSEIVVQKTDA